MRCTFCATGKGGFARNLAPHEIMDQVLTVQELYGRRVSNVGGWRRKPLAGTAGEAGRGGASSRARWSRAAKRRGACGHPGSPHAAFRLSPGAGTLAHAPNWRVCSQSPLAPTSVSPARAPFHLYRCTATHLHLHLRHPPQHLQRPLHHRPRLLLAVFMGMGEPLLNLPSVTRAYHGLNKQIGIGGAFITISTVGA